MYILDVDPYLSATFLIKNHITRYIDELQNSFCLYNIENYTYSDTLYVAKDIIYSEENYIWYSKFFESLQEMYKIYKGDYRPLNSHFKKEFLYNINRDFPFIGLKLPAVTEFNYLEQKVYLHSKYLKNIEDVISKNRVLYILNNYKVASFIGGVPSWYTSVGEEIYNGYNKIDRKKIKIVAINGNYKYYTSTISDRWEEIENVPHDMKYIVNSIIF